MIPDAAVEAAADIVRQAQWGYLTPERAVRYILEAAAPHMLAEAKADALDDAAEWLTIPSEPGGGFAAGWLRTRAATHRTTA